MLRRTCPVKRPWPASGRGRDQGGTVRLPVAAGGQTAGSGGPAAGPCIWIRETAAVNDVAIDLLDAKAGERVVEIGCGPGRALGSASRRGCDRLQIDFSPGHARRRPPA